MAGNAAFTWTDRRVTVGTGTYGTGYLDVHMRRLTASGLEPEIIVNTTTAGGQFGPGVAATGSGLVVAWQGDGPGDDSGIFAQRFAPPPIDVAATNDVALMLLLASDTTTTKKN